jgi:hypothetical protein
MRCEAWRGAPPTYLPKRPPPRARPPPSQWNASVELPRCKHTPAFSSQLLAVALPAACLCSRDARSASVPRALGAGGAFDALHHRDAAFTRGDATTGWDHGTTTGPAEQRRWLERLDARARAGGERRCRSLPRGGEGGRRSLVAREAREAGARRAGREAAAAERRERERRFGPDGAAALARDAAAAAERERRGGGPRPQPRIPPSADDLRGVATLPDRGLLPDD